MPTGSRFTHWKGRAVLTLWPELWLLTTKPIWRSCRVELPADRSKPLSLTTTVPDEGEPVFLIGNPLRLEGSVSDGIVSAIREVPDLGRIIQITAPVSHGNSGSPLFNMRGQVIGIVTVKVTNGQNINLALGVPRIASLATPTIDIIRSDCRAQQINKPA